VSCHPPADPGETGKIEGDDGHVGTGSKLAPHREYSHQCLRRHVPLLLPRFVAFQTDRATLFKAIGRLARSLCLHDFVEPTNLRL
jgi:hypothetical protein